MKVNITTGIYLKDQLHTISNVFKSTEFISIIQEFQYIYQCKEKFGTQK